MAASNTDLLAYGGHYYRVVFDPGVSRTTATSAAASSTFTLNGVTYQGYLATITSGGENDFIESSIKTTNSNAYYLTEPASFWLGGEYLGGRWTWTSGPDAGSAVSYTDWGGVEASQGGTQPYIVLNMYSRPDINGAWYSFESAATSYIRGYVIEYRAVSNSAPTIVSSGTLSRSASAGSVDAAYHYIPGQGYSINGHTYIVTNASYAVGDNLNSAITALYGSAARLASWEELAADLTSSQLVANFLSALALPVETPYGSYPNLYVTYKGTELDGTRGRWFISNFSGSNPSLVDYASFGSIANQVYLGSYNWSGQALVRIDNALLSVSTTPENVGTGVAVYTVSATDPDPGNVISYSIVGGADASRFNINSSTGAITFKSSPDYEAPSDADGNNVYLITVQASDGSLTSSQAIGITVTDTKETPTNISFYSPVSYGVGSWARSVDIGKLNNDANADVVVANEYSGTVSIFSGDGTGKLSFVKELSAGNSPISVSLGDFNRDGIDDIVVASGSGTAVTVLMSNGEFGFQPARVLQTDAGHGESAIFDVNKDGLLDLVVASTAGTISVALNDGSGWFQAPKKYTTASGSGTISAGDFNNDGWIDVAAANYPSSLTILYNDRAGGFTTAKTITNGTWALAVGNLNSDAFPDIVAAIGGSDAIYTYTNVNGGGSYSEASYPAGSRPGYVVVHDLNRDGYDDVLVADQGASEFRYFLNSGTGSLSSGKSVSLPSMAYSLAVGDLNNDGLPDVISANASANSISVFVQKPEGITNSAPTFLNGLGQRSSSVIATPDINEDAPPYVLPLTGQDIDGDTITYSITSTPLSGTAILGSDRVTYTPNRDYNGKDSFVVTATDGKGGIATLTVNVTVAPVNDAPFVLSSQGTRGSIVVGSLSVTEDAQAVLPIAPFQDIESDNLSYSIYAAPTSGEAKIASGVSSSGTTVYVVQYTPSANYSGTDMVVVAVSDGKGGTATQTFNITVTAVNDAPSFAAASQAVSVTTGSAKSITLSATDVDGDTLTYNVAAPGKGTANISGNTLTYTPSASAAGSDSFVVTASDGKGGTATQSINVTISAATAAKAFTVYTASGWVGSIGGNGAVYGTNGFEDVRILYGQVSLDGSFNRGGDILRVADNADAYVIGRTSASSAYIESTASKVSIPIGSAGMGIVFADGVRSLAYSGGYKIGSQTFTVDPAKITATADSTVLPSGADPAAQATIYMNTAGLSGGTAADITVTGKAKIMGTNQADVIKLGTAGVDLVFDGSFNRGGDIIVLDKAAGDYSAAKFNASTIVLTALGEKLTIPLGTVGMTLRFTDGDRTLVYKSGAFYIGDQTITSATATALTPSSITLSADQGVPGSSVILDATGKVIFTDDAAKTSNIILKNFGADDVIRVTGASAGQYNFAISDADPKDLEITYTDPATSATNTIVLDDVIKTDAFIASYQTAATALGWNFMTFG